MTAYLTEQISDFLKVSFTIRIMKLGWHSLVTTSKQKFFQVIFIIFLHNRAFYTTECIVDIKNWMTSNFLLLNSEKTEVLIIGPKTFACNNLQPQIRKSWDSMENANKKRK